MLWIAANNPVLRSLLEFDWSWIVLLESYTIHMKLDVNYTVTLKQDVFAIILYDILYAHGFNMYHFVFFSVWTYYLLTNSFTFTALRGGEGCGLHSQHADDNPNPQQCLCSSCNEKAGHYSCYCTVSCTHFNKHSANELSHNVCFVCVCSQGGPVSSWLCHSPCRLWKAS